MDRRPRQNAYDGFYRRTVKKTYTAGGALDKTRDYFYSLGWQVLEERLDSGSGPVLNRQFVWGQRHIDDLVLRDRDTGSDGTLDERLYALHDAMHVTAVTNTAGAVQERYGYDGFGKPRFMDAAFGARSASSYDWETLFDAYRFDTETSLYHVRFRYLHPNLGRWLSRDPLVETEGPNLYFFLRNSPVSRHDAYGLQSYGNPVSGPGGPVGPWDPWAPGGAYNPLPTGEVSDLKGYEDCLAAAEDDYMLCIDLVPAYKAVQKAGDLWQDSLQVRREIQRLLHRLAWASKKNPFLLALLLLVYKAVIAQVQAELLKQSSRLLLVTGAFAAGYYTGCYLDYQRKRVNCENKYRWTCNYRNAPKLPLP